MDAFYIVKFNEDQHIVLSDREAKKFPYIVDLDDDVVLNNEDKFIVDNLKINYNILKIPFYKKDFMIIINEMNNENKDTLIITRELYELLEYLRLDESFIFKLLRNNQVSSELTLFFEENIIFENKLKFYDFFTLEHKLNYLVSLANLLTGKKLKNYKLFFNRSYTDKIKNDLDENNKNSSFKNNKIIFEKKSYVNKLFDKSPFILDDMSACIVNNVLIIREQDTLKIKGVIDVNLQELNSYTSCDDNLELLLCGEQDNNNNNNKNICLEINEKIPSKYHILSIKTNGENVVYNEIPSYSLCELENYDILFYEV